MKTLLFRADGSKAIGLGHLTRDLDIADLLKEEGFDIEFLVRDNDDAEALVEGRGYETLVFESFELDDKIGEMGAIANLLTGRHFDIIVLDVLRFHTDKAYTGLLKKHCDHTVCLTDDTDKLSVDCDLVFALSANQKESQYDDDRYHVGPSYFPLGPEYRDQGKKHIKDKVENILATFGGSDVNDLTFAFLSMLEKESIDATIVLILGAAFANQDKVEAMASSQSNKVIVKKGLKGLHDEIDKADMAVCSAGNSLLEIMSCGVPALVLPQSKRESEHADAYKALDGIVRIDGFGTDIDASQLGKMMRSLMDDLDLRKRLSQNSPRIIDGKGIQRIVDLIRSLK